MRGYGYSTTPRNADDANGIHIVVVVVVVWWWWLWLKVVAAVGATRGQRRPSARRPPWRGSAGMAPEQAENHANQRQNQANHARGYRIEITKIS